MLDFAISCDLSSDNARLQGSPGGVDGGSAMDGVRGAGAGVASVNGVAAVRCAGGQGEVVCGVLAVTPHRLR
jgi:hypothetical protein